MSIGLIALLDDIAAIAKVAAASLDDVANRNTNARNAMRTGNAIVARTGSWMHLKTEFNVTAANLSGAINGPCGGGTLVWARCIRGEVSGASQGVLTTPMRKQLMQCSPGQPISKKG